MTDTITISLEEYKGLLRDKAFLNALEEHGVDEWINFEDAVATFELMGNELSD